MAAYVCVEDYEKHALERLPASVRDYYKSGAGEEYSAKWNREAFKNYRIRPRFLRDVSKRDISTTVLGHKVSMPLGVAPTAMQRMAHPDGECANARAAQAAGTIFILSTLSTSSIEEVAEAAPEGVKWFQLYVYTDRNVTLNLVRRAERAGFKALVLTIDAPFFGDRRADLRNKFSLPSHLRFANFQGDLSQRINSAKTGSGVNEYVSALFDTSLTWDDVKWFKRATTLSVILKGILTVEDARLAVENGVDGIIVSNHGARQIDSVPATIEVLPEISKAVGDKVEVYMDGGVMQGIDVFKALALGAKMVFFGRPMLWGLVHDGERGASEILELMRREIDLAFGLTGCASVKDVTRDMFVIEFGGPDCATYQKFFLRPPIQYVSDKSAEVRQAAVYGWIKDYSVPRRMAAYVCVEDYEKHALERLPASVRDYYKSGAGEEYSVKWNKEAFKNYRIRPRFLRDVSKMDISTTVLGYKVSMPLGVAPTAMQRMAHPDGECANARAAQAAGTIFILSTLSTSSIEEVAEAAPEGVKWFQLYVYTDRNVTLNLIRRAERAGFKALVLTIDGQFVSNNRRADLRNKFSLPSHLRFANFQGDLSQRINSAKTGSGFNESVSALFDASLTWDAVEWVKRTTTLSVILKGILTIEDARLAVENGVDGIMVSNHGARQIDSVPATIEVLPEISKAVGDKVEVYMDGGVTQGIDVFKALALGAKMVFFGRPMLWGLVYDGERGASEILELMRREIDLAFALTGCASVKDVTRDMVIHASYYSHL